MGERVGTAVFLASSLLAFTLCFLSPAVCPADAFRPGIGPDRGLPKVAIIIDDMGYDLKLAREFFALELPVTLAVIPVAPYAAAVDSEAEAHGYETMAHIPMEPLGFPCLDPGPGALLLDMDAAAIESFLEYNLARTPRVAGVSNHMGSAFTGDRGKMEILLSALKLRDLFFVDSLTSPDTVCFEVSRELGVRFGARDVFLDHDRCPREIENQLLLLLSIAERNGRAVGIGHPYPETIEVLTRYREELLARFHMVPVSEVVRVPKDARRDIPEDTGVFTTHGGQEELFQ